MLRHPCLQKLEHFHLVTSFHTRYREGLTVAESTFPPFALTHLLIVAAQVGTAQLVNTVGTLPPLDPALPLELLPSDGRSRVGSGV